MKTSPLKRIALIALFSLLTGFCQAQFAGPAGTAGTSAMHKDSSAFVNWASNCLISRGLQDIAVPLGGVANFGTEVNGTGKAGLNPVVSLGDRGTAILSFPAPIVDGPGFDFAVFENSFSDDYLELAFVEVSSDGVNYFRFPATSNTQTLTQIGPFDALGDATKLNNLAGKYRANYGTPFDLQELSAQVGLNINAITHVKVVDVVGRINESGASYDKNNNPINDPYPTAFGNGGFDLDAVGVIHQQKSTDLNEHHHLNHLLRIYPNPANDVVHVDAARLSIKNITLRDVSGKLLLETTYNQLSISELEKGVYFLNVQLQDGRQLVKRLVKA